MMMIEKTNVVVLFLVITAFSFLFGEYSNEINFASAQSTGILNTVADTIKEFEKLKGSNIDTIRTISILHNTIIDVTEVSTEDCINLPDGSNYCP
jgi:hypothetical protein